VILDSEFPQLSKGKKNQCLKRFQNAFVTTIQRRVLWASTTTNSPPKTFKRSQKSKKARRGKVEALESFLKRSKKPRAAAGAGEVVCHRNHLIFKITTTTSSLSIWANFRNDHFWSNFREAAFSLPTKYLLTGSGLISSTLSVFTFWEYFTRRWKEFPQGMCMVRGRQWCWDRVRLVELRKRQIQLSELPAKVEGGESFQDIHLSKIYIIFVKPFSNNPSPWFPGQIIRGFKGLADWIVDIFFERRRKSLSHIHVVPAFALSDRRRFIWQRDVTDVIFDALFIICHIQSMESCCRRQCYIVITWLGLWLWYRDHKTEKSST